MGVRLFLRVPVRPVCVVSGCFFPGAALGKLLRDYVPALNIPGNLRKLITDVLTVLLGRLGLPEEKINAFTDAVEKKEERHMFERLIEGLLEEKQLARAEGWKEGWKESWAEGWKEACEKTRKEEERKAYLEKLESARKIKTKGFSDEDIAESLSLPVKDVEAL
jgi:hypothetical protein